MLSKNEYYLWLNHEVTSVNPLLTNATLLIFVSSEVSNCAVFTYRTRRDARYRFPETPLRFSAK